MRTKKAENLQAGDMFVSLFAMPEYPPAQPIAGVIHSSGSVEIHLIDGMIYHEVMNEMIVIIEEDK